MASRFTGPACRRKQTRFRIISYFPKPVYRLNNWERAALTPVAVTMMCAGVAVVGLGAAVIWMYMGAPGIRANGY